VPFGSLLSSFDSFLSKKFKKWREKERERERERERGIGKEREGEREREGPVLQYFDCIEPKHRNPISSVELISFEQTKPATVEKERGKERERKKERGKEREVERERGRELTLLLTLLP